MTHCHIEAVKGAARRVHVIHQASANMAIAQGHGLRTYYENLGYVVTVTMYEKCTVCRGRRFLVQKRSGAPEACPICRGTGHTWTIDS